MKTILVTGANGQLGRCLQDVAQDHDHFDFKFFSSKELDITNEEQIDQIFKAHSFDYCINCAAYTAVDKAEKEKERAYLVNAEGVRLLANACKKHGTTLIQISTDFVFDGAKRAPYNELDKTIPINVYGQSKLQGEEYVASILDKYFIIRTSWVYSEYGHNFLKTMQRLGREREEINVVQDQIGTPTYAKDLAEFLVHLLSKETSDYGIYNFSNSGETTWYEFAKAIFQIEENNIKVKPIFAKDYKTLATRPKYSVLDKSLVKLKFDIAIPEWTESLKKCIINK